MAGGASAGHRLTRNALHEAAGGFSGIARHCDAPLRCIGNPVCRRRPRPPCAQLRAEAHRRG
ncbi:hypothetical protein FRAAL4090 [Frankia alni ACN14a]|uniref:Uncharacterized protein n=1 Tax=Frankia alni (strain DSM 45986 / CECT 9034 / ACN14a) TaxID=326424 RepID=Q0RID7_FRAAA|nr:hypothetical protein FRAAL4090 [Frankia alni ACN14a]